MESMQVVLQWTDQQCVEHLADAIQLLWKEHTRQPDGASYGMVAQKHRTEFQRRFLLGRRLVG